MQRRKIANSEIGEYFEEVRVVTKKDASDFAQVISDQGVERQDTWIVGDSIRSDINPALQVGAKPMLYVYTHHSYYWRQEYGVIPLGSFHKIDTLEEAVEIFENPEGHALTTPADWLAIIENLPQRE